MTTDEIMTLADALEFGVLRGERDQAAAELRRLYAENEAVVADAERYRWLRQNSGYSIYQHLFADCPMRGFKDAQLDAAIDAARAEVKAIEAFVRSKT